VHGGGWYGRDPHNRMICTCKFVVTIVIVGAWLLRLHVEKSVSVHNCSDWRAFHVMNMEEDQAAKLSAKIRDDLLQRCSWRQSSGMSCCRGYFVRSWSLRKGVNSGTTGSIGAIWVEVSSGRGTVSGMAPEWWRLFSCLDTCYHPVTVRFWPLKIATS